MTFMEQILARNVPIWDRCAATPFLRELQAGTLPFSLFRDYMIQDSIYLKHYARAYGKAIYHAAALEEIQRWYSALGFVTDKESAVRLDYLRQFGMTDADIESVDPLPENRAYIRFLLDTAERGDIREILMAVLPCMMSYSYIFRRLAAQPGSRGSRYWAFIQDYADDAYDESCREWSGYADRTCGALPPARREALGRLFERASLLELDFWHMAYRGQEAGR